MKKADLKGRTPLHFAATRGNSSIGMCLLHTSSWTASVMVVLLFVDSEVTLHESQF